MERHSILSGRSRIEFDIESAVFYPERGTLKIESNSPFEALDDPEGAESLELLAEKGSKIAVVIPDATRAWQNVTLMAEAVRSRIEKVDRVDWVIGGGQHRLPTEEEKELLLGKAKRDRDHVYSHDPEVYIDTGLITSNGNPVTLHKKVLEADAVVLIGGIVHHELAGFSGGRKAVIPGVSGKGSIIRNHSFCLDNGGINPMTDCGKLEDNPVHEDMMEYVQLALKGKNVFILNVIPDENGTPWRYVAGDLVRAWEKGVEIARELQVLYVDHKMDFAIVSPGGHPYDLDLYQSTKSITAVKGVLREGGMIIMAAELEDGAGPGDYGEMVELAMRDRGKLLDKLENEFTIPSFCAFKLVLDSISNSLILVSTRNDINFPGMICSNIQEALDIVKKSLGGSSEGLILKAGNCVVVKAEN